MGESRRLGKRLRRLTASVVCLAVLGGALIAVGALSVGVAAASVKLTPYPLADGSGGTVLTAGPDGNLWFTENGANKIARATPAGVITEFTIPTPASQPHGIAAGPDGNLWFAERDGNKIGRITTAGVITEYSIPTAAAGPTGIAAGPDGNLWFAEWTANRIGRITTAGVITEFPIPNAGANPFEITAGPDGNVWFTEDGGGSVGRITLAGVITEFPMPGGRSTFAITAGADGNLWASSSASAIARITPAGVVTEFPVSLPTTHPNYMAAGPDGNVWYSTVANGTQIGVITPDGTVTEFPFSGGLPTGVALGPDGNLWTVTESNLVKIRVVNDPTGEFTSLTPERILDTRTTLGGHLGKVGAGESFDLQITGKGGVPASGVSAVVLNVTVTDPTDFSYLTAWPSGRIKPTVSNLNFEPRQTVPNLVTVMVGNNGKVGVYNNAGAAHVVVDVAGFYADASGPIGSRFHGVTPSRILDTRNSGPIAPNGTRQLKVTGVGGVPNSATVSAVVMNVTVTTPTADGYLTVWPDDATRPVVSNLNFTPGLTVPNLVTVRVPASGIVGFYNSAGSTHVVVDVVGYYDNEKSTEAGRFVPLDPMRILDTRLLSPFPPPGAMLPGTALFHRPAVNPNLPDTGMGSIVINVTVTQPSSPGWLAVFPGDQTTLPLASNLNWVTNQTVPNLVIVKVGTGLPPASIPQIPGWVTYYNRFGTTHVVADIAGYFTDSTVQPASMGSAAFADEDSMVGITLG